MEHGKYLGFLTFIGYNKSRVFQALKERFWKKLIEWKEKFLSRTAKEILIEAVVQVIATYSLGCFRHPKKVIKELNGLMSKFWQDNVRDNKGFS